MVCGGISHNRKLGSNFIGDFFGEEFEVMGDYIEEKLNVKAFERSMQLIGDYEKKGSDLFVIFIRFSIDWLVHRFGISSMESSNETANILRYISLLTRKIAASWKNQRTLFLMISDHGHKPADGGLVTVDEIKDMFVEKYEFIAANQSALNLYHEWYRALVLKSKREPIASFVRKKGNIFLAFDSTNDNWIEVRTFSPEKIPTFSLKYDKFGVGYTVGEFVLIADNFYFGSGPRSRYPLGYHSLKSIHGGLTPSEINVLLFMWRR